MSHNQRYKNRRPKKKKQKYDENYVKKSQQNQLVKNLKRLDKQKNKGVKIAMGTRLAQRGMVFFPRPGSNLAAEMIRRQHLNTRLIKKIRPVVVITDNSRIIEGDGIINVLPLSTRSTVDRNATHALYQLNDNIFGAIAEQIITCEMHDLGEFKYVLDEKSMHRIDIAMAIQFGIDVGSVTYQEIEAALTFETAEGREELHTMYTQTKEAQQHIQQEVIDSEEDPNWDQGILHISGDEVIDEQESSSSEKKALINRDTKYIRTNPTRNKCELPIEEQKEILKQWKDKKISLSECAERLKLNPSSVCPKYYKYFRAEKPNPCNNVRNMPRAVDRDMADEKIEEQKEILIKWNNGEISTNEAANLLGYTCTTSVSNRYTILFGHTSGKKSRATCPFSLEEQKEILIKWANREISTNEAAKLFRYTCDETIFNTFTSKFNMTVSEYRKLNNLPIKIRNNTSIKSKFEKEAHPVSELAVSELDSEKEIAATHFTTYKDIKGKADELAFLEEAKDMTDLELMNTYKFPNEIKAHIFKRNLQSKHRNA